MKLHSVVEIALLDLFFGFSTSAAVAPWLLQQPTGCFSSLLVPAAAQALCAELEKYSYSAKIAKSKFGQSEFVIFISISIIFEDIRKKKMVILSNGLTSRSPQSCVNEILCFCYN